MSKGGDTTTTNTTTSLPAFAEPYYRDLMAKAQTVSNQTYTPYQGQRLADFSDTTNQSFDMIRGMAGQGQPGFDAAATAAQGIAGYQANPIGTSTFADLSPEQLQQYMNPYTQNVLDTQKQRATQTFQEQQAARDADAIKAGAFGGSRRFVSNSLAQRDLNQQLQDMDAKGLAAAFDNATNLWSNDTNRQLQASIASEEARRAGAGLGLDAATRLSDISNQRQQAGLDMASALSGVGAKEQQRTQAGLDLAYQDFQSQRDWPAKQLSLYSQLLSGTPISPNSSTATTTPAPDFLSQLLGIGVTGAGIWNLLK